MTTTADLPNAYVIVLPTGEHANWKLLDHELKKLLEERKLSATEAATELSLLTGTKISRNAVIGRARRSNMKFARPPNTVNLPAGGDGKRIPRVKKTNTGYVGPTNIPGVFPWRAPKPTLDWMTSAPTQRAPEVPVPDVELEIHESVTEAVVTPMSDRVQISDLREVHCRWPMGDPRTEEFRYCGAESPIGRSYCAYHHRVAYQPSVPPARKRRAA